MPEPQQLTQSRSHSFQARVEPPAPTRGARIVRACERDAPHTLSDGVRATLGATRITVERADGTLLFVYDAGTKHGKVTLASESLALGASGGDLLLSAAGAIRLEGRSLAARFAMPGHESTLLLDPRRARLRADALELSGAELKLDAPRTELAAEDFEARVLRARFTFGRLEAVADSVVARAENVYQHVAQLLQQQVGSLRTLVAGSAQLKAREVTQRADETYKVRAESIQLG